MRYSDHNPFSPARRRTPVSPRRHRSAGGGVGVGGGGGGGSKACGNFIGAKATHPPGFKSLSPIFLLALTLSTLHASADRGDHSWRTAGGNDYGNTRHASDESAITRHNVGTLVHAWNYTADGEVTSTPTAMDGWLYFTDTGGSVHCVNQTTGFLRWKASVPSLSGIPGAYSRSSPAISPDGRTIVIGLRPVAAVMAIRTSNGTRRWMTTVSTHYAAWITQSPAIIEGYVHIGVSSNEEQEGPLADTCCTFRGSQARLSLADGAIDWQTYTLPDNGGVPGAYSGVAIWGGPPSYDPITKKIVIATGNTYTVPPEVSACLLAMANASNPAYALSCVAPGNHQNSIVAIGEDDGRIDWYRAVGESDTWNFGCGIPAFGFPPFGDSCPPVVGDDFDFGQTPILKWVDLRAGDQGRGRRKTLLAIAGQKSGIVWALKAGPDCDGRGSVVWSRWVCPGGTAGGMMWGSAADDKRLYVACANSQHVSFTLATPTGNVSTSGGIWAALDLPSGEILWATPDPNEASSPYAMLQGAVTVANGVVFGGSMSEKGSMCALDAATGQKLFQFDSGGSVIAGPSVVDGMVFWPSGYYLGFVGNAKVFAFKLP